MKLHHCHYTCPGSQSVFRFEHPEPTGTAVTAPTPYQYVYNRPYYNRHRQVQFTVPECSDNTVLQGFAGK